MDTIWLDDLAALAETLNFGRAARLRNVTQPAFGRRIRALEDWTGVVLVDRTTHRMRLTPAGEAMLACAQDVSRRLERGRREASDAAREVATLRFCATHALSLTFFPRWLRGLQPRGFAMPVQLSVDNMAGCERLMREGRADFLICHSHPAAEPRLDPAAFPMRRLAGDVLVPVSRRLADGRPRFALPGEAAAPVPLLSFDEPSGMGRILGAAFAAGLLPPIAGRAVFTSHMAMMLKTMAEDGQGIAWSPRSLLEEDLGPTGKLALAGGAEWAVPVDIVLVRAAAGLGEAGEQVWSASGEMGRLSA
ncbi:LysR substrate-binding domain-containing protein [Antarcticirhabdus aurantiaca]|uniref:LysR substrate-binding domain-containing protein n=1 Tax=Antarcticirhabdus aurantiaca TaxID=2606717 RepID=A0ACD4NV19_9HYPH|nr:LysR substrate-binding domain-containing protein [Antarcticirhabdus aurantiaca]WAJ30628.1 LysR substrate-binding domain-containing protein [Jeongeuplla avenae]